MGVILFECATGHKPFNADSLFDLLRKHVDESPPSPRHFRPDMPPAYEQVILTLLAKDPNQRFGSAGAIAQALQAACAGLGPEQWAPVAPSTMRLGAQRPGSMPGMTPANWPSGWTPIGHDPGRDAGHDRAGHADAGPRPAPRRRVPAAR